MVRDAFRLNVLMLRLAAGLVLAGTVAACASGPTVIPDPRPMVIRSGARLNVDDKPRLQAIYDEISRQVRNIELDPTFLIAARPDPRDVYPWETLEIEGDTARVSFQRTNPDIRSAYEIYAHLHLMRRMGRLDEWLPEVADAEGWPLERAIVQRTTDAWLLGRAVFDTAPYGLLDELVYAQEAGWLDALLFALRGNEFAAARDEWRAENPGAEEAFGLWYRDTFAKEPPGATRPRP